MQEIKLITQQGINYIDEVGTSQFIDFESCYQNFLMDMRKRMSAQYLEAHKGFYEKWKVVGERFALSTPPSLVFYTCPMVEFTFSLSEKLGEVEKAIRKFGYRTRDSE